MKTPRCGRMTLTLFVLVIAIGAVPARAQIYTDLYNFGSKSGDPVQPSYSGIVAQGRDGNLYSTSPYGGSGSGTVFKITSAGTLTVVYNFDGTHGATPFGGLSLGTDGNFYGTTSQSGTSSGGTVFNITPSGQLSVLYNFTGGSDGAAPYAPPIQGTDGNFYGTTTAGGSGYGTVYKLTPAGKLTPLYQFDYTTGAYPDAPLTQGTDGNFYGTTAAGGSVSCGCGEIFRITPVGKFTLLYAFEGTLGYDPIGPLLQGSDGNFYGTTVNGDTYRVGDAFRLTPAGKLKVLYKFHGGVAGGNPYAGLVQATDGNFYGVNSAGGKNSFGNIFKITPTGGYTNLYNFDKTSGASPEITLLQHTSGILYGDTSSGGTGNMSGCSVGQCGVFYSWSASSLPAFVSLLPYSGQVGKTIGILGQGFSSSSVVQFGGVQATSIKLTGTNFISATVPTGALTGSVTVTTGTTTLTSNKQFRVTPRITGFSPPSGKVGTPVMITGVSLMQTTKVTFGGVKATTFTVNSDKLVTANVPTGAKTGKIAITTPGGTAVSSAVFTVTQ
jgi:uncharacterized repeat protein (TIGR03803 family)